MLQNPDIFIRYRQLSHEEFSNWERAIDRHGLGGLRVTRIQEFR